MESEFYYKIKFFLELNFLTLEEFKSATWLISNYTIKT